MIANWRGYADTESKDGWKLKTWLNMIWHLLKTNQKGRKTEIFKGQFINKKTYL